MSIITGEYIRRMRLRALWLDIRQRDAVGQAGDGQGAWVELGDIDELCVTGLPEVKEPGRGAFFSLS